MKKILVLAAAAVLMVGSVSAMDMTIGVKGIVGPDNNAPAVTDIGGGIDINLNLWKGLGVQVESNIVTSKITNAGNDGLTFTENLMVNVPVMGWYNIDFSHFGLGAGLGVSCCIATNHTEADSSGFKMGLAAGADVKWHITDDVALVMGVTGNLDCFPTLTKKSEGNSSTYKFVSSDFSRNAIYGSLGVQYRIPLSK